MNERTIFLRKKNSIRIKDDWYDAPLPSNMELAERVYIGSSFSFRRYHSELELGFRLQKGAGCYDGAELMIGKKGLVEIGDYTIFKGAIISNLDSNHKCNLWEMM